MILLYKVLGGLALVAALFSAVNAYNGHQQNIGYLKAKAEFDADLLVKVAAARAEEKADQAAKDAAISKGVEREKELRRIISDRDAAARGLRFTVDRLRERVQAGNFETCNIAVVALTTVFEECVGRYSAVAEIADRHASDVQLLLEAP